MDNYMPQDCQVSVIDPKGTEFISFSGHDSLRLYGEDGTVDAFGEVGKSEQAVANLKGLVREMNYRMVLFAQAGVGNIKDYRAKMGADSHSVMPFHVAVVDEFYDLLMNYPEAEEPMGVLAAKARSAGIHLVLATQRPSADVVRGALKANLSTRIALKVASRTDSQVILDRGGAETLCGRGDMLYMGPDGDAPVRLHGCYVSNGDIQSFVKYSFSQDTDSWSEYKPAV
jgi:S-DNA-T family DNA segregation ATPase FtsK/SpoIIIE